MKAEKKCPKCKTIKSISEFNKNKKAKDELHSYCKSCLKIYSRIYRQSDKTKVANRLYQKRYRQTEKGKAYIKHYRKCYRQTENGKAIRKEGLKRFFDHNPNHLKAKTAVNNAIRAGKLSRPNTKLCHYCSKPAQQYHHWHGYEPEHWLDVVSTCKDCHYKCKRKTA